MHQLIPQRVAALRQSLFKWGSALGVGLLVTTQAYAQWVSGEIRRVDPDNLRLTIKHAEIKSLDMPPMTMVFYVKDKGMISNFNAQDKIEFQAAAEGSKFFVTEIRKAP